MTRWRPDPTCYPSPREALAAPAEKLAYVAAFDRSAQRPDAIAVLDTDPSASCCATTCPTRSRRGSRPRYASAASRPAPRTRPRRTSGWPGADGGLTLDERFFPHGDDFRGGRVHQVRLQGGDASSDSYRYP
jgi:56kDa selenium binding protein (SBP56)